MYDISGHQKDDSENTNIKGRSLDEDLWEEVKSDYNGITNAPCLNYNGERYRLQYRIWALCSNYWYDNNDDDDNDDDDVGADDDNDLNGNNH